MPRLSGIDVIDAAMESRAQQHDRGGARRAQQQRQQHDQRLLRLNRPDSGFRLVDDANVAHRAGLADAQLLLLVHQLHVNLLIHLHVAGEAQDLLLHFRQRLHLFTQPRLFRLQRGALFQQRPVSRVHTGIELGDLRFARRSAR